MAAGVQDPTETGNPYIDPLLSGWRWDGAPVSYGFAQTAGVYGDPNDYYYQFPRYHFEPVSQMTEEAMRALLEGEGPQAGASMTLMPVSGFTNLTFVQSDPSLATTDMRFGVASTVPNAYGFVPGERHADEGADGDVWLTNVGPRGTAFKLQNPVNGSWAYYANLWAVGKALGLQSGYTDMPADKQFAEYTLMTYYGAPSVMLPSAGNGAAAPLADRPDIQNLDLSYHQTYMMLDIAALQTMYGANYSFRNTDTVYAWSPTSGATYVDGVLKGVPGDGLASADHMNMVFHTVWDGGGVDTYDLSNYSSDLKLNLEPGEYSTFSEAQRPYIGRDINDDPYYARGNVYNALLHDNDLRSLIENAEGGSGNDIIKGNQIANELWGNAGNDTLQGGGGDDELFGGEGDDTARFTGNKSDYTIEANSDGGLTVTDRVASRDETDKLTSIKFAAFLDQTVDLTSLVNANSSNEGATAVPPETAPLEPIRIYRGKSSADKLHGSGGSDKIFGYAGNDVLNGAFGNDYLSGGSGQDSFVFKSSLGTSLTNHQVNFDTIDGFTSGSDKLKLSNKIFEKLGKPGLLKEEHFAFGKATDANDHIIYNRKTGILSYDSDGSGEADAIEFAWLKKRPALSHTDFHVI